LKQINYLNNDKPKPLFKKSIEKLEEYRYNIVKSKLASWSRNPSNRPPWKLPGARQLSACRTCPPRHAGSCPRRLSAGPSNAADVVFASGPIHRNVMHTVSGRQQAPKSQSTRLKLLYETSHQACQPRTIGLIAAWRRMCRVQSRGRQTLPSWGKYRAIYSRRITWIRVWAQGSSSLKLPNEQPAARGRWRRKGRDHVKSDHAPKFPRPVPFDPSL